MPNTGHTWTEEEIAGALKHSNYDEFAVLYPGISYNAWRHKRREVKVAEDVAQPTLMQVSAAPAGEFVGFVTAYWDLETTGLTAIMGRLLSYSSCDPWGNITTFRYEDFPGATLIDDGPLVVAVRDHLEQADHWVTWNGKLFDIPFLNARLLKAGERPLRSDIKHTDLMYYSRGQFVRIGSSKLDNVSKFVDSPNRKTPLEWDTWQLAGMGDKDAMEEVVEHNRADVLVTRDVFAHLKPHIRNVHR